MAIKRTSKASRPAPKAKPASRPAARKKSSAPAPRSQFVKQNKPAAKPTTPAKKGVTRTLTKPKTTQAGTTKPTLAKGNAPTLAKPTTAKPTKAQVQEKATKPTQAAQAKPNATTAANTAPKQDETKPAGGGGFLGGALNAFGFGGNKPADKPAATDKPAAATDKPTANKPAAEKPSVFGNLLGGAKDALMNTALDGMGLGDFKDIGLADRLSKLTSQERQNLMDLAGSMKKQEGSGPQIDLKQHLGKLSTEEKGKLFDLAASGKLKTLMADLPRLQKAAEASKPNQQELQALQQISQMLGRDKLGGADGRFNFGDMDAIAQGLMRDRGGLRQQVLGQLNAEGKRFQARVANRALSGRRGLFTRKAMNQINQQVPSEIKGRLSQGLNEAQTNPQTAQFRDNAPRNISFNEMQQFERNMQTLKSMQDRLGQALGAQVVFPQGVSQEAINHTIQGALDPQADARNIDRVLQSIIHQGRVELPLPPGGVLVPR